MRRHHAFLLSFLPKNGCVRAVIGENKKMRRFKNKTMHAFPKKKQAFENTGITALHSLLIAF
jgi:hypothetical protein